MEQVWTGQNPSHPWVGWMSTKFPLEIPAALLGCDGAFYRLTETEPFCVRATDNA